MFPLSVKVVLFVPLHTVVPPEIVPETEDGITVIVPSEVTEPHPPVRGIE